MATMEMETKDMDMRADDRANLEEEMRSRAAFYRFLSDAILHEFTSDQVEAFRDIRVQDGLDEEIANGFSRIRRYLTTAGADPRTELACDYARVFLSAGVYDGLTAEPYESVFTSDEKIMMQDARDDVVRIYRENQVDVDEKLRMPEDHLGLEFEFLAVMAEKTADALDAAKLDAATAMLVTQRDFLDHHILNWIDPLSEKVVEFAELPFYPAIMDIARAFVQDDRTCLDSLLVL